jgi:hypothetical protein
MVGRPSLLTATQHHTPRKGAANAGLACCDSRAGCDSHRHDHDRQQQLRNLLPTSPQSVIFPVTCDGPPLLGYSSHSESSSASFDVQHDHKAVGQLPLYHRYDSFSLEEEEETFSSRSAKKRVSFSTNQDETYDTIHRNDMSGDEKAARWYQDSELKRIRKECRITARLIREGHLHHDTGDHCVLGLDGEAHSYAHQREIHRLMVRDLVLTEQDRQRERGLCDPEGLSGMVASLRSRCRHAKFMSGVIRNDRRTELVGGIMDE